MEKYYRMIISLYQDALAGTDRNLLNERIQTARIELAKSITTAHIANQPDTSLVALVEDINRLEELI